MSAGTLVDIDVIAEKLYSFKLTRSYDHPAVLQFKANTDSEFVTTVASSSFRTFLRFWDADDVTLGCNVPLFEGFISDIDPGSDSTEVVITAIDPTGHTDIPVFSLPWTNGTTPGAAAVPRVVYNSKIDNDDDYMWEKLHDATLGEIIEDILTENLAPLQARYAAPGVGRPYYQAEVDVLTFKPQEKIVLESESPRSAVQRVLEEWAPQYKLDWEPGNRKWRILDLKSLPSTTVTLNDIDADHVVLSMQIDRSVEGRYTSVKIYGPEEAAQLDVTLNGTDDAAGDPLAVGLTDISTGPVVDTYGAGVQVYGKNKWQITDATKRRVVRFLPELFAAPQVGAVYGNPTTGFTWLNMFHTPSRSPTFMVRFPSDNMGPDYWVTVEGWQLDAKNGIIDFGDFYVHQYNPNPPTIGGITQPNWTNPTDVRLVYATPDPPLTVRYPTSGYGGTAYTVAGIENELAIYDEMLAVDYEYGVATTTAERVAQFTTLAQHLFEMQSDIIYTGGLVLEGMDYTWWGLDRRINVASEDTSGSPATTGLEAINAFVTEVEYDYDAGVTTLTVDGDKQSLIGSNAAQLKSMLKIRALEPFVRLESASNTFPMKTRKDFLGRDVTYSGIEYQFNYTQGYVDKQSGEETGKRNFTEVIG